MASMEQKVKDRVRAKNEKTPEFIPETELGRAAIALRKKALQSGRATKTAGQILREIEHRRAGSGR